MSPALVSTNMAKNKKHSSVSTATTADALAKVKLAKSNSVEIDAEAQAKVNVDLVFAKYGEPFVTNEKGKVHLNERAVAAKCASEHMVKYNPMLKTYERYDAELGLWQGIHEVEVRRLIGDLLLQLGEKFKHEEFVKLNKNSQLQEQVAEQSANLHFVNSLPESKLRIVTLITL